MSNLTACGEDSKSPANSGANGTGGAGGGSLGGSSPGGTSLGGSNGTGGSGGSSAGGSSSGTGGSYEVGAGIGGSGFNQCGVAAPLPKNTGQCTTVSTPTITNFDDYTGGAAANYNFHVNPNTANPVLGSILHVGDGSDTGDAGTSVISTQMVTGEGGTGYALQISDTNATHWGGLLMFFIPGAGACLDAHSFGGVQFLIKGTSPSGRFGAILGMLDTIPTSDNGLCSNSTSSDCKDASVEFTLPADPATWTQIHCASFLCLTAACSSSNSPGGASAGGASPAGGANAGGASTGGASNRWHVYASSVSSSGAYNIVYTSFSDFTEASSATLYYMDLTPGFNTYVAAPELFYFTPQKKWYLVYQAGPPKFSTADDPSDPSKWTQPAPFFATTPAIITQNGGGWLDFWVICDTASCHLFFSDNHGRWYTSKTAIDKFPSGFGEPVVVMQDSNAGRMFEASNVYKMNGTNQYLALIEAFDQTSGGHRYFRSWIADSLDGPWLPWQSSGSYPFAGTQNVTFQGSPWTNDISHGEAIRAGYDETLAIEPCNLRYLFQGADPTANTGGDYNKIPWRIGLLTQTP